MVTVRFDAYLRFFTLIERADGQRLEDGKIYLIGETMKLDYEKMATSLFEAIRHGDAEHQRWLEEKAFELARGFVAALDGPETASEPAGDSEAIRPAEGSAGANVEGLR